MSGELAVRELPAAVLAKARKGASTRHPAIPLATWLGVPQADLDAWQERGRQELVRLAANPRGRVRPSEQPYVELARLTGVLTVMDAAPVPLLPGQPSRLTDAVAEIFYDALERGLAPGSAAALAGVARSTVYGWRSRGESGLRAMTGDEPVPQAELPYVAFALRWAQIEAVLEEEVISAYRAAMKGDMRPDGTPRLDDKGRPVWLPDWRAAESFADRRLGKEYRKWSPQDDGNSPEAIAAKVAEATAAQAGRERGRPVMVIISHAPVTDADPAEADVLDLIPRRAELPIADGELIGEELIEEIG